MTQNHGLTSNPPYFQHTPREARNEAATDGGNPLTKSPTEKLAKDATEGEGKTLTGNSAKDKDPAKKKRAKDPAEEDTDSDCTQPRRTTDGAKSPTEKLAKDATEGDGKTLTGNRAKDKDPAKEKRAKDPAEEDTDGDSTQTRRTTDGARQGGEQGEDRDATDTRRDKTKNPKARKGAKTDTDQAKNEAKAEH